MKLDVGPDIEGKYLQRTSATARAAEEPGFSGLWTSETRHTSFSPLMIAANEIEQVEVGTSVAIEWSIFSALTGSGRFTIMQKSKGKGST